MVTSCIDYGDSDNFMSESSATENIIVTEDMTKLFRIYRPANFNSRNLNLNENKSGTLVDRRVSDKPTVTTVKHTSALPYTQPQANKI